MNVLVTGATGYVGGRLIPELLREGHRVRVLVRDEARIRDRIWWPDVEVFVGDLTRAESLAGVADGIDAAFYLVHSMGSGRDFAAADSLAAHNFGAAAKGLAKVVYLGGLYPEGASEHLQSRADVGEILRASLPTTELRAGPIIGSGSASFEMVRYLTERLPVMITPRWVRNSVQPISVTDILSYLRLSLLRPALGVVDVGADVLTFRQMMEEYAAARGLKRTIIPLPVLAPRLAALWVGLVTPINSRLAVPLIEGVVTPVVGDTSRALALFPEIRPRPYREAVRQALQKLGQGVVETRWSGALHGGATRTLTDSEGLIREVHSIRIEASPSDVYEVLTSLGGERGWLAWNAAWRIRGALDRLADGPGLRRGRRHPSELLVGEAVDFWRVEALEAGRLVRLRAEMLVPGAAWLQWEMEPDGSGTRLIQSALFDPTGVAGLLYWYALYPIHGMIFTDLLRAIRDEAEEGAASLHVAGESPVSEALAAGRA